MCKNVKCRPFVFKFLEAVVLYTQKVFSDIFYVYDKHKIEFMALVHIFNANKKMRMRLGFGL